MSTLTTILTTILANILIKIFYKIFDNDNVDYDNNVDKFDTIDKV